MSVHLPALLCPVLPRKSPHADRAREDVRAWVVDTGLVEESALVAVERVDPAGLAARAYPTLPPLALCLVARHLAWLFVHDDEVENLVREGRHQALALETALLRVVSGRGTPLTDHPVVDAMVGLHQALRQYGGPTWYARFRRSQARYLRACMWEIDNDAMGVVPDVTTYTSMRRLVGGVEGCFDLLTLGWDRDPRDDLETMGLVEPLCELANDQIVWANDVLGVFKEIADGATGSVVLALVAEEELGLVEAIHAGAARCDAAMRAFLHLEGRLSTQRPDRRTRDFVAGLRAWMRGHLDWVVATGRFAIERTADGGYCLGVPPEAEQLVAA